MGYRTAQDEFVVYARKKVGNWFVSGHFSKTASRIKSMVTVSRPDSKYYYLKDRTRNITQDSFIILQLRVETCNTNEIKI